MDIVFLGVRHWHTQLYLDPVLTMSDMRIVGVSDPDSEAACATGAKAKCKYWTDFREMCAATRPDFAFILGRHSDMAEMVRFLIESGIPFAVEKPAAASAQELVQLADAARAKGVFASVAFVLRNSEMLAVMREALQDDQVLYASFQFIGGLASRYQTNGPWMLKRATAAGGGFLNLGIHFVDLYAALVEDQPVTLEFGVHVERAGRAGRRGSRLRRAPQRRQQVRDPVGLHLSRTERAFRPALLHPLEAPLFHCSRRPDLRDLGRRSQLRYPHHPDP